MSKEKASKKLRKENLYIPAFPYWNEDYSRELRDYTACREFFERMMEEMLRAHWDQLKRRRFAFDSFDCCAAARPALGLRCEIIQRLDELQTHFANPYVIDPHKEEPCHE